MQLYHPGEFTYCDHMLTCDGADPLRWQALGGSLPRGSIVVRSSSESSLLLSLFSSIGGDFVRASCKRRPLVTMAVVKRARKDGSGGNEQKKVCCCIHQVRLVHVH